MGNHSRKRKQPGSSPGTLVHIGQERATPTRIHVLDYDETRLEDRDANSAEDCFPFRDKPTVTWINVDGIHQVEIIEKLGKHFGLHPLTLEDIVNTNQRPKMEDNGGYLFIVLKILTYDDQRSAINTEQLSIILGSNFVISFQEEAGDDFDPIRERVRHGKGRIRKMGADYLAYALIDAIVDHYFVILEKIGEKLATLEDELVTDPQTETLTAVHRLKREMILLRKSVWPVRELISGLERGESELIHQATHIFLRDVYDHTIQVIDTVETYRDMLSGMLDLYLSTISNKLNSVMKVLTIISTIFIPLTFVAGIYGMNFDFMPELHWRWGYPVVLLIMFGAMIAMLWFFRRKKWL